MDSPKTQVVFESILEFWECLPRWQVNTTNSLTRKAVGCNYPPFYLKYAPFLSKCPKLWEKISIRFQTIIESIDFGIGQIRFHFLKDGIAIGVEPSNACAVCPDASSFQQDFQSHNIDRMDYCLALFVLLSTALDEIYFQIAIWEKENPPKTDIDPDFIHDEIWIKSPYRNPYQLDLFDP